MAKKFDELTRVDIIIVKVILIYYPVCIEKILLMNKKKTKVFLASYKEVNGSKG